MQGVIELSPGELDLVKTMQCGQTFCWNTVSGTPLYDADATNRFYTTVDNEILIVWQEDRGGDLYYEATGELDTSVESLFRLHEPLQDEVLPQISKDDVMEEAVNQHQGIRIIQDEFLPCLISYLCSPQMRIPRIKELVNSIMEEYGATMEYKGHQLQRFPSLYELSNISERKLRRMKLGYRSKYVESAVNTLIKGDINQDQLQDMDYRTAHNELKELHGVGDKVADCVLLFSLGFTEAFPLDTWAQQAIQSYYPEHHVEDDYHATAENMRNYFGADYAGYAQEYLFHHVRSQEQAPQPVPA